MKASLAFMDGDEPGNGNAYQRHLDGDADGAIAIARTVLTRHQRAGNKIAEARSWMLIAVLQYHAGDNAESCASMESALIACADSDEKTEVARGQRWLGRIHERKGGIAVAESHFRAACSAYASIGDHAAVAHASLDIGDMRYLRHDHDEAAAWWVRSWQAAEELQLGEVMDALSERYAMWIKRSCGTI